MKLDFGTVSERDMDLLFLNAFVNDKCFLQLFIDESSLAKTDYDIDEIFLSKSDKDGESDITVILKNEGRRFGLLIEDKIDAIDMLDQPERYQKRGETAVKNHEYEAFDVFLVCPEKYFNNNDAAKRYPHSVKYEEIREYWGGKNEPQYEIYLQQISQAIEKAKKPPKVVINENANRFIRRYKDYQEENYPNLNLRTSREANGYWAHYTTRFGSVYLFHKIVEGRVDLTFNNAASHIDKLEMVANWLRKHDVKNVRATVTGKAGALRVTVPKLDMQIPFDENDSYDIDVCFKTISELIEAANVFGAAGEIADLVGGLKENSF